MKRFCCWCGKEESTKTCESEDLKKAAELFTKYLISRNKQQDRLNEALEKAIEAIPNINKQLEAK